MRAIVAARDARGRHDAISIAIDPRRLAAAANELDLASLAHEPRLAARAGFVPIEHAEDARIRDAIDIAGNAFATRSRAAHAGISAEIVEPTARRRGADIACGVAQPSRHLDVDE